MTQHRHPVRHSPKSSIPWFTWLAFALAALLLAGGLLMLSTQSHVSANRSGSAVEFTLNDFAGKTVNLSDYRGHPVLVNLWASWCPPCRAEMPTLIQFYKQHQPEGLVLLAVNSTDTADSAKQFIQQAQMPFPVLYDPEGQVERAMGVDGLPSSFLFDREGTLRFTWTGQIPQSVLDQRVLPLLSQ